MKNYKEEQPIKPIRSFSIVGIKAINSYFDRNFHHLPCMVEEVIRNEHHHHCHHNNCYCYYCHYTIVVTCIPRVSIVVNIVIVDHTYCYYFQTLEVLVVFYTGIIDETCYPNENYHFLRSKLSNLDQLVQSDTWRSTATTYPHSKYLFYYQTI